MTQIEELARLTVDQIRAADRRLVTQYGDTKCDYCGRPIRDGEGCLALSVPARPQQRVHVYDCWR